MNTYDLDQSGRHFIDELGGESACYKYQVGPRIYPAYTCLSVNDEVVHGIINIDRVLKEGDVISVDVCTRYNGYIGDNCRTVPVGSVEPDVQGCLMKRKSRCTRGLKQATRKSGREDIQRCSANGGRCGILRYSILWVTVLARVYTKNRRYRISEDRGMDLS